MAGVTFTSTPTWTLNARPQQGERQISPNVTLTVVSQRPLGEDSTWMKNQDSDVFVAVRDDLVVRLRLTNNGKETVYYLASIYEPTPTGYVLYKQVGDIEWKATSPARGREGSLTGGGYEWRPLPPHTSTEFEFTDLSKRTGEHAASVLVNTRPDHIARIEVISDSYRPKLFHHGGEIYGGAVELPAQPGEAKRLYSITVSGKAGFVDSTGRMVIQPRFELVRGFSEGRAAVKLDGKWGVIDEREQFIVPPTYDDVRGFTEGFSPFSNDGQQGFIDRSGKVLVKGLDLVWHFSDGLAGVQVKGKWGYINRQGAFVIKPEYDSVGDFKEGLAPVKRGDESVYINREGKVVLRVDGCSFSEGLACIKVDDQYGFMNTSGQIIIGVQFDEVGWFSEGLVKVRVDYKWGYVDRAGRLVIKPQFDDANDFSEGLAAVKQNGKAGYIDRAGQVIIKMQFETACDFDGGLACVEKDDVWSQINRKGTTVWTERPSEKEYAGTVVKAEPK
jgi:hypothetical protein